MMLIFFLWKCLMFFFVSLIVFFFFGIIKNFYVKWVEKLFELVVGFWFLGVGIDNVDFVFFFLKVVGEFCDVCCFFGILDFNCEDNGWFVFYFEGFCFGFEKFG